MANILRRGPLQSSSKFSGKKCTMVRENTIGWVDTNRGDFAFWSLVFIRKMGGLRSETRHHAKFTEKQIIRIAVH